MSPVPERAFPPRACFTTGDANFCGLGKPGLSRVAHNHESAGSNPAPATNLPAGPNGNSGRLLPGLFAAGIFTALSEPQGSPGTHKPGVGGAGLAGGVTRHFAPGHNFSPRGASLVGCLSIGPSHPERGEFLSRCVTGTPKTVSTPISRRAAVAGGDFPAGKPSSNGPFERAIRSQRHVVGGVPRRSHANRPLVRTTSFARASGELTAKHASRVSYASKCIAARPLEVGEGRVQILATPQFV